MYKSYDRNKFIYHFTSAETTIDHILPSLKLRFSPYTKTNDPYETKNWSITIKNSLEEIDKINDQNLKSKVIDQVMDFNYSRFDFINKMKERIKVLCFSEDIKDFNLDHKASYFGFKRGWGYPRMWAQYGHNHKGVCLMFNKEILKEEIKTGLQAKYQFFSKKIEYTDELANTDINKIDFKDIVENGVENSIAKKIEDHIRIFFFRKANDWRDEREFRIVLLSNSNHDGKDEYVFSSVKNSLKVIVLGGDIEPNLENKIEELAKRLRVRLYKVDWEYSTPMITNGNYISWSNDIENPFL